ncbi:MAG: amidohydrolase, partial [Cyanobacteria bacterium J06638_6]
MPDKRSILMAFAGFAFSLAVISSAQAQDVADTIYQGGAILTMDDAQPQPEALAVKDGEILAVGPADDVMQHQGDGTEMVDLGGRALIPGFV